MTGKNIRVCSQINITPLIDVLLVLLVFMVITPVTPKGFQTAIPQPPPPGLDDTQVRTGTIVLSLDRNGVYRINQDRVERESLIPTLVEILKTRRDRTVFVLADTALLFADVAGLIDSARGREWIGSDW